MQRININRQKGRPRSIVVTNLNKGRTNYSYNIPGIRGRKKTPIRYVTVCDALKAKAPTLDNNGVEMK